MNNLKTKNKMNNKINLKFCLITLLLMCCVSINAQQSVTVNLKNASLKQVFNAIEKQTTYRFSYRNVVIDSRHDINVSCSKAKVNTVLDIALRGRDLTYSVVSNKSIVITDKARQTVERAQQNDETLHGVISDRNGEPIIGATVMEKGSKNGTVTDVNGQFSLKAQPGNTLVVSYIGFADKEVRAARQMEITMMEQSENLDEVVVVGYGTMKKSDMTGAISTVKTEDLVKRTTTNPAEALQGKVAGVNIMKSGGLAGSSVSVKIRGVKTFGSNEPLYIIDGFQGDITSVNPQDIESMEIMKDGAAAAIYGSVAANGVVIVTTKNGKKGDMKIDFNSYLSFTSIAKKLQLLDADGYKKVHKMMYDNYNAQYPDNAVTLPAYITNETGVNTDWQDATERNGLAQNYMISMRGGSEKALYSLSYNHAYREGNIRRK
jgi:TonB-linked SusC/RagA family outer membrane protein